MTSISTSLLPAILSAAIDLFGTTECPTPGEVASALARLQPAEGSPATTPSADAAIAADLRDVGGVLRIALRSRDGKLTAERTLPRAGSCADLAAAAAVVIETWRGETRTDVTVEIPAARAPAPRPVPAEVPAPDATTVAAPAPAPTPRARRPWDVGLAAASSLEGDLAWGALVDGHVGFTGSGLAGRLALLGTSAHARSLGSAPGQARWSREAVALGIRDRVAAGRNLMLDVHADVLIARIQLDGAGFGTNLRQTGLDVGVGGGVAVAWKPDAPGVVVVAPFAGIDGTAWPREKVVSSQGGGAAQQTLPRFELRAVAGIRFGRF